MTFYIANLNPLRFTGGAGNKFDRLFMEDLINKWQSKKCYLQKWNLGDVTRVQVLSDFVFTFKIYNLDGIEVADIEPLILADNILDKTFTVYEIPLTFNTAGTFYAVIEYENNTLISEAWQVGDFTESTMVFTYRNSENNFSILFDTGIEFKFRVEGLIADFEPKSDDVIYNDQMRNSRVLNSIPWRSFTMYAGQEEGIPEWVADKVNRIMACDIVFIDSQTFDGYISKVEGAEWEIVRAQEYAFIGLKTEIMPVDNNLLERLKRGENGSGGASNFKIVQKVDNYYDINGSLTLPTTFAKYRLLEKICIEKQVASPAFNLRIGTTNGGAEIGEFLVDEPAQTFLINYLFLGDQPVYLTGITSILPFLSVIYKNLIETITAGGGSESSGEIPLGAVLIYSAMAGKALTDDFDVLTGLGREATGWVGWALCNGQNGTPDLREKFVLGYANGQNNDDQTGGQKEVILTVDQMPRHSHEYANNVGNEVRRGVGTGAQVFDFNNLNQTSEVGNDQPHNNMPPYIVKAYVQKIF